MKLICDLGLACSEYQDKAFRNLGCKRIQCDEIWSFIYAKEKNCTREHKTKGAGDIWTWVALDPDSKLVPCWFIGQRHAGCAYHFLSDLQERLAHRVQLTTDGHKAYLHAVEDLFGTDIGYAMLHKIYGAAQDTPETRYSPAICMGARETLRLQLPPFGSSAPNCTTTRNPEREARNNTKCSRRKIRNGSRFDHSAILIIRVCFEFRISKIATDFSPVRTQTRNPLATV